MPAAAIPLLMLSNHRAENAKALAQALERVKKAYRCEYCGTLRAREDRRCVTCGAALPTIQEVP